MPNPRPCLRSARQIAAQSVKQVIPGYISKKSLSQKHNQLKGPVLAIRSLSSESISELRGRNVLSVEQDRSHEEFIPAQACHLVAVSMLVGAVLTAVHATSFCPDTWISTVTD